MFCCKRSNPPKGENRYEENGLFLQIISNPQSESAFQEIKAYDKVIVTENVYVDGKLIASNGQMGYVVSKDMEFIGALFPSDGDGTILIEPKDIKLAYAHTVHKFQGSESDSVIFVIPPSGQQGAGG